MGTPHNDSFSVHDQHGRRNCRYSSGSRPGGRGRTFYGRRTQQPVSVTAAFNSNGQKTSTQYFSAQNGESNHDISWQDRQTNVRAHADRTTFYQNNWQERNGYLRNNNTRGSRSHAYNPPTQHAKTTYDDLDDFEDDEWPLSSTGSMSFSASDCSSSSLASTVAPLSPGACVGWCPF